LGALSAPDRLIQSAFAAVRKIQQKKIRKEMIRRDVLFMSAFYEES
jgi:hypothetical protein